MGEIVEDLPCVQCEYNLRGLRLDSRCPECGTIIHETMINDFRAANPAWRRKVRNGCALLLAGVLLRALVFPGAMLIAPALPAVLFFGSFLCIILGALLLTAKDPAADEPAGLHLRVLARLTVVANELLRYVRFVLFSMGLVWGVELVKLLALIFLCVHLSRLAKRAGHSALAAQCIVLIFVVPVALVATFVLLFAIGGGIWPMGSGRPPSPLEWVLILAPAVLVLLWFAYIMIRLMRLFSPPNAAQ